jgi:hypothetical protein
MNQSAPLNANPSYDDPLATPAQRGLRRPHKAVLNLIAMILIFLMVIALPVSIMVGVVYFPNNFEFMPAGIRAQINRLMARTTLPKTESQIFLLSSEKISKIVKFQHTFFANMDSQSTVLKNPPLVAIRADGPLSFLQTNQLEFSQTLSMLIKTPIKESQSYIDIRLAGSKLFFKINSLPSELNQVIRPERVLGQWYEISQPVTLKPAVQMNQQNLRQISNDTELLKNIQYLGQQVVGGKSSALLRIKQPGNVFFELIEPYVTIDPTLKKDLSEVVKEIQLDVWIDMQTYYPYRVIFDLTTLQSNKIKLPIPSDLENLLDIDLAEVSSSSWNITGGWEITSINQPIEIFTPAQTAPFEEFLNNYSPTSSN